MEEDDSGNVREIYNITDILSTPSIGFYKYEPQQKLPYEQYKAPKSSDEKAETKDRYYIYSIQSINNDGAEEINRDEKTRNIWSSTLSDRKSVSRNISMVLENLLMSYENSQLPTHGQGSNSRINHSFIDEICDYH